MSRIRRAGMSECRIRAQTRVVDQKPAALRWPIERAQLVNRHNLASQRAEARRKTDVSSALREGRERARDEMAEWALSDGEFRRYFVREAAERLGHQAGLEIDRWLVSEVDPILAERKRIFDSMLHMAQISVSVRDHPSLTDQEPVMVTRVDFPRREFHFAQVVPRYRSLTPSKEPQT